MQAVGRARWGEKGKVRRHRGGRIVWSLLAVLAFVGLVPLSSVAWKLIDINREALTTAQQEYQLLLASSISREVDIHVGTLQDRLARTARTLAAGSVRTADVRRLLSKIEGDAILYLRFTDVRGRSVESRDSARLKPELESLFTAGVKAAAEALEVRQDETSLPARLTGPILMRGPPPEALLVVSVPVAGSGRLRGVVSALVDFQQVWEQVVGRNRTGHTIFALDEGGLLFASSDPVRLPPGREMHGSGIVQRFLNAQGRVRETMPFTWIVDGAEERFLGSYEVSREGWGIFVQAAQRQVYHPVRSMIQSTLSWALAVLSVAILGAIVFAGTLSNPINRLAAASRSFARGDFTSRVQVSSRNEIGELASTFNRMAEEIEDRIRLMKRAAEENKELFLGTIRALANAIDAKDPYTRGHSVRVNRYAVIIATYMGLPKEEIEVIHVSSVLHDVGKIGIHDSILNKPGGLTPQEFSVMKTHPTRGAEIMAPIRQMEKIIPGMKYHHERWNGSGYPEGLRGDEIPLAGRIIAVADTFDAMTTDRPYQKAFGFQDAVDRINELKGVAFDERVVEAFNRACQAGEFGEEPRLVEAPTTAIA